MCDTGRRVGPDRRGNAVGHHGLGDVELLCRRDLAMVGHGDDRGPIAARPCPQGIDDPSKRRIDRLHYRRMSAPSRSRDSGTRYRVRETRQR